VQTTFRNIKFANNIPPTAACSCGRLAYTAARVPLPYPPYGTLNFFDQTAKNVLDGIKSHRGITIVPTQTGPVIDVLYSAAGNSADEAYYANGIIGFDFEIGTITTRTRRPASLRAAVPANRRSAPPPTRARPTRASTSRWSTPAVTSACSTAMAYGAARPRPSSRRLAAPANVTQNVKFTSNRRARSTTLDGSTSTTASTEWKPPRACALPLPISITDDATLKWIATDFKGNVSAVGSKSSDRDRQADRGPQRLHWRARSSRRADRSR
jgi:hypothetical protein